MLRPLRSPRFDVRAATAGDLSHRSDASSAMQHPRPDSDSAITPGSGRVRADVSDRSTTDAPRRPTGGHRAVHRHGWFPLRGAEQAAGLLRYPVSYTHLRAHET